MHDYAYLYVTASGRSLPSPLGRITVGQLSAPPTALTASPAYAGPGNLMTPGSHRYYVLFRTATGTTLPGPVSNSVTAEGTTGPPAPEIASGDLGDGGLARGSFYYYRTTFYRPSDGAETELSGGSAGSIYTYEANWDAGYRTGGVLQQTPPPGFVQRVYRTTVATLGSEDTGKPYARIVNLRAWAAAAAGPRPGPGRPRPGRRPADREQYRQGQ